MDGPLTHDELLRLFSYDASTGLFTRNVARGRTKIGDVAGTIRDNGSGRLYIVISINYVFYYAHRLAFFYHHKRWPKDVIDHINGDSLDNRLCNLRECDQALNAANAKPRKRDVLPYRGVQQSRNGSKFLARLSVKGKYICLGSYDTPEEAHAVWREAKRLASGEFANTDT